MEYPTRWANEFVRELLWQAGRWQQSALEIDTMDAFLSGRIAGVGRIKCRMNYRHLFELTKFIPATYHQINTDAESWAAPALFLAWDRRHMAGNIFSVAPTDLIKSSVAEEDYKLLGLTETEFAALAVPVAAEYAGVGGIARFKVITKSVSVGGAAAKSPGSGRPTPSLDPADLSWLTAAGVEGAVERQIRQRLAQKRDQILAAKLKALYDHQCMACGTKLLMGLSPKRFYVEAAHIKPLGKPHDGPDIPANMIVLCPNHHLQFDRGVITVRMKGGVPVFVSRIAGDPINGKPILLHPKHPLDPAHVHWHHAYFLKLPRS